MKTWSIQRHGGNSNHVWRTIYTGNEDQCRERFEIEVSKLRQGGVLLCNKEGHAVEHAYGPRLLSALIGGSDERD